VIPSRSRIRPWIGLGKWILVISPFLLLWWTFRQVPFGSVWATMQNLKIVQVFYWLVFNAVIVILMTGRWWVILRAQGYPIPYLALTGYRLASFAVSYFTPGPQFGGEPLQVLALRQQHQVPGTTGTASVSLDKLLEMIANFSFLVFGIAIALSGTWLPDKWQGTGMLSALILMSIPLAYLVLMLTGHKPLTLLVDRLPRQVSQKWLGQTLREVEHEISRFCTRYPRTVLEASFISLGVWGCMVFEYWLITWFLGLRLTPWQVISALVAARLALLTPLPGGLGALEASQILAIQTLGLSPAFGFSIALMIRFRDLLFGIAGFMVVVSLLGWQRLIHFLNSKEI